MSNLATVTSLREFADRLFASKRPDAIAEAVDLRASRLDADQFKRRFAQAVAAKIYARSKSAGKAISQGHRALVDPDGGAAA